MKHWLLTLWSILTLGALAQADWAQVEMQGDLNHMAVQEHLRQVKAVDSTRPLAIMLDARGGPADDLLELAEVLAQRAGQTAVFVEGEAVGTVALLPLVADRVAVRPQAIVGDLCAFVGGARRALSSYEQAQARALLQPSPFRTALARAMMQADVEIEVTPQLIKPKGERLILTGREAAELHPETVEDGATPTPTTPLLAEALLDTRQAFWDYIGGQAEVMTAARQEGAMNPEEPAEARFAPREDGQPHQVYVVPIEGPIDTPQLYILRRALKEAITKDVDTVVLHIDTPGGRVDVMLDMIEALVDKYEGRTVAYISPEAISAGAYISVACNEIYFAENGIMGAAAVVAGGGQEIEATMRAKIESYLQARMRVIAGDHRYRADVLRAMSDMDFEFVIDGEVIKSEGELLSLTAEEAMRSYGLPPEHLLADGIATDIDDLMQQLYGQGNYEVQPFDLSWSESFAKWFGKIAGLLGGIGVLLLIIEIKTPHFGLIGGAGIALLVVVFLSQYFAGLSGYEALILLGIGVILIAVELFVTPGVGVLLVLGLGFVLASFVLALADVWPSPDGGLPTVSGESLWNGVQNLILTLVVALAGLFAVWRFLPASPWGKAMVLAEGSGQPMVDADENLQGATGSVTQALRPGGEVEINGERYPARVEHGSVAVGARVRVLRRESFNLLVEGLPEDH